MKKTIEEMIDIWFGDNIPDDDQFAKCEAVEEGAKAFARIIVKNTPNCVDQAMAIRKLREVVMLANASICCVVR